MEIVTERLTLREYSIDDWRDVLAYQSDPVYLRYYPWLDRSEASVKDFIQQFITTKGEDPRLMYQLAITINGNHRVVGSAGIRLESPESTSGDIGIELSPEHWGKGLAAEAGRAILRFGFEDLSLHRVWARLIADNTRSVRLVERLGMLQEGRLRENEWFKGRWWDTLVYGMLDYEWYTRQEQGPGSNPAGFD